MMLSEVISVYYTHPFGIAHAVEKWKSVASPSGRLTMRKSA
jgi:hypothetical protein